MSEIEKAIIIKERIVYELATALGIDPEVEDIDSIQIPDSYTYEGLEYFNTPARHNFYVALKRNYEILKQMKESNNNG